MRGRIIWVGLCSTRACGRLNYAVYYTLFQFNSIFNSIFLIILFFLFFYFNSIVAYYSDWIEYQIRMNSGNKGIQPPPTKRTPPPATRPTQQTPQNPLNNLPPGYVVIIKPGNSSHVHPPPQVPTPPYQHRHNRTNNRGSSSSSMISANKLVQLVAIPVSLVLFFIRMS